jgi:hypothetical protein
MAVNCKIPVSKALLAALVVALAQFAIAPSAAQARCGDYVLLGGRAPQHSHMASDHDRIPWQLTAAQFPAHPGQSHPDQIEAAPLHRGPCSGPNCSNDGPRPLEEPAAPVETDVRDWGLVAAQHPLPLVAPQIVRFADDAVLPRIAMGAVFRPPR